MTALFGSRAEARSIGAGIIARMKLPFTHAGLPGVVDIHVAATEDPAAIGAWPHALGLAYCEAVVDYPGRGDKGRFGWVQMVRSTDNNSGGAEFEMDPLTILGVLPHPFAFFGIKPTLFDAPARDTRKDLEWLAHAFLCHFDSRDTGDVRALTGFSWGFSIVDEKGAPRPAVPLESWDEHLPLLHAAYPSWRFAPGFWTS
jgi:hypothetical protein